jgi:hypothetical protein
MLLIPTYSKPAVLLDCFTALLLQYTDMLTYCFTVALLLCSRVLECTAFLLYCFTALLLAVYEQADILHRSYKNRHIVRASVRMCVFKYTHTHTHTHTQHTHT